MLCNGNKQADNEPLLPQLCCVVALLEENGVPSCGLCTPEQAGVRYELYDVVVHHLDQRIKFCFILALGGEKKNILPPPLVLIKAIRTKCAENMPGRVSYISGQI